MWTLQLAPKRQFTKHQGLEFARPWVRFPAGLRCVFSSDPAVSSSVFVGAEREENLIRNDPDKREFTKERLSSAKFVTRGVCTMRVPSLTHQKWCALQNDQTTRDRIISS